MRVRFVYIQQEVNPKRTLASYMSSESRDRGQLSERHDRRVRSFRLLKRSL